MEKFYSHTLTLPLNSQQKNLLSISHAAVEASNPDPYLCRMANSLNGNIVTESESDDPEQYAKKIIAKKRKSLAQRTRRLKAKSIAERNFLCRRTSKWVNTILERFPDIGKSIESYVSWRRTGMLTFDGN